eukprot:1156521-Pelagomonas_calceolata.AAC.19
MTYEYACGYHSVHQKLQCRGYMITALCSKSTRDCIAMHPTCIVSRFMSINHPRASVTHAWSSWLLQQPCNYPANDSLDQHIKIDPVNQILCLPKQA